MIEFTILLDDSDLHFEPLRDEPKLAFILPPTARIGRFKEDQDVVHLAPIPVHCFFNAMTLGHWLAGQHGMSDLDSLVVYMLHDMFKSLLTLEPRGKTRSWPHSVWRFDDLRGDLDRLGLDDSAQVFLVARNHHSRKVGWREAARHEATLEAGVEAPGKSYTWDWPLIGLTIRLQSGLSNALSIAYVKRLFVESYVEAMRREYPDVFDRFDAISYVYEFVDPAVLTGDVEKDIKLLCQESKVYLDGRRLVVRTFIGAHGSNWTPDQRTVIRLPFWLVLTLHVDPVSILFPVPTLHGSNGEPADNPAFVEQVRNGFHRRVRDLLMSASVSSAKRPKWDVHVDEVMAAIDDTFHVTHTTAFDEATDARRVDGMLTTTSCSMCGSQVPESFVCSPVVDLGASVSNYTDWHLGSADRACVLCAVSHFKTPAVLESARRLIFQRKVVYFATSTPSARKSDETQATLPFFTAAGFTPQLEIRSLESLVTLNVVAALYLYNVLRRAVYYHNGERDLWLEGTLLAGPFSFAGEVATAKNKARLPSFLNRMYESLNRPIVLLDPLLPMEVEVPFHVLACLWGVSKGRHYEFKYKPLIVSNETAGLPVIWEGYHFVDRQMLAAIDTLRTLAETFRHPNVSHRMKMTALASGPEEFIETLVQLGGFNYETVLARLIKLSGGLDVESYLKQMADLVVQTPLITEIWG